MYDPLKLAPQTAKTVCREMRRKYYRPRSGRGWNLRGGPEISHLFRP
jgi:hypothetical protein